MNFIDTSYRVLYTKSSNKKRKTYQDGELLITSGSITLVDDQRKDVYKKKCYNPSVKSGEEITLGPFDVQIEDAVDSAKSAPTTTLNTSTLSTSALSRTEACGYVNHSSSKLLPSQTDCGERKVGKVGKLVPSISTLNGEKKFASTKFVSNGVLPSYSISQTAHTSAASSSEMTRTSFTAPSTSSAGTSSKAVESNSSSASSGSSSCSSSSFVGSNSSSIKSSDACEITLDTALIRVMRPHQIEAANFLIRRLLGASSRGVDNGSEAVPAETDNRTESHRPSHSTLAVKGDKKKSQGRLSRKRSKIVDTEDEYSGDDSLCDSDGECFEVKPPRYVESAHDTEDLVPLSFYTGAILADEVH
jgi:Protein of unknown function (DUF2439)